MLKIETIEIRGKQFKHFFSDADMTILEKPTDVEYEDAACLVSTPDDAFIETDHPIVHEEQAENQE